MPDLMALLLPSIFLLLDTEAQMRLALSLLTPMGI